MLPPVEFDAWVRCEPVPVGEVDPMQWLFECLPNDIYPVHPRPVHVFSADTFAPLVHNLPLNAAPVGDFTLDLGNLVWEVAVLRP